MTLQIQDTTPDDRLTGLEKFLEFWLGPRKPEYGEPVENLANMELPGSLRRFYLFAGRWPPALPPHFANRFHHQDCLLPLDPNHWDRLYRLDPYFVFASENQGVWEVATLARGDDPPVWVSHDWSDRRADSIGRPLDHPLSHFLVSFILQESLFSSEFLACHEEALSTFLLAGCRCEPIWHEGEFTDPEVRHSYFLIDRHILLRKDTGNNALDEHWYGFHDPATVRFLESLKLPTSIG